MFSRLRKIIHSESLEQVEKIRRRKLSVMIECKVDLRINAIQVDIDRLSLETVKLEVRQQQCHLSAKRSLDLLTVLQVEDLICCSR